VSRINENKLTKLYYSIGEVSKMFEVNTSLIRFWEKEFPSVKLKKNSKGNRVFTVKDIVQIEKIYILVKEQGYTLDGAKKALKSKAPIKSDVSNDEIDIIQKLNEIKNKLLSLKS